MSQADNPWQTRRSTTAYENNWIRVDHEDVTTPAGTPGIYGVVHFKLIAVGIAAIDAQNRIVLVGQYRYPLKQMSWEIPEGGCPENELPLDCARRELAEEAGLTAEHWQPLLSLHLSNSVTDEQASVFLAAGLKATEMQREPTEADMQIRRVDMEEALAMIQRSEITDAISVAAILKLATMPQRGV